MAKTLSKRWSCLISILFTLLTGEFLWAQQDTQRNLILGRAEFLNTSSEFQSSGYVLKYNNTFADSSDLLLTLRANHTNGKTSERNFNFQTVVIGVEKEGAGYRYFSRITFDQRAISQQDTSQNILGDLGGSWDFSDSSLFIEGGKKSYAQEFQSLVSVRDNLTGPYYLLRYNYSLSDKWQMRSMNKTYYISDDNRRMDLDAAIMYGISPKWPWIWIGFGTELLTNSIANTTGYWSPRQFVNIGPRLDIAIPIFEKYTFSAGLNLNKFNDIDFGDGTGYYAVSKLAYGNAADLKIEGGIESISSEQNLSKWTSTMFFIGASCPF